MKDIFINKINITSLGWLPVLISFPDNVFFHLGCQAGTIIFSVQHAPFFTFPSFSCVHYFSYFYSKSVFKPRNLVNLN